MLKKLKDIFSQSSRLKRGRIFVGLLPSKKPINILDLGGGDGSHIHGILQNVKNCTITVADISKKDLSFAEEYGFKTKRLKEDGKLPFNDDEFDVVFCNSVIEHVTMSKNRIWACTDSKEFNSVSLERQLEFANEIRRISKSYFVQTPYKYFIIESHSWLPVLIVFLPRSYQIKVIRLFNKFWPKRTSPDWYLLTSKKMRELFPDAEIVREKSFGLTKSLIAIKQFED